MEKQILNTFSHLLSFSLDLELFPFHKCSNSVCILHCQTSRENPDSRFFSELPSSGVRRLTLSEWKIRVPSGSPLAFFTYPLLIQGALISDLDYYNLLTSSLLVFTLTSFSLFSNTAARVNPVKYTSDHSHSCAPKPSNSFLCLGTGVYLGSLYTSDPLSFYFTPFSTGFPDLPRTINTWDTFPSPSQSESIRKLFLNISG